ncbi:MAG: tail fiber domain-containing protein [Bacteroidales bacterium]|nr:tail fiber domain-containing protein [Bacteroidales bacterium]
MKATLHFIFVLLFLSSTFIAYSQNKEDAESLKSDPNTPIFEIKNDAGQTVFAVYPGGVKIFIDSKLKAAGGGFTVGSLSTGKAVGGDIFSVSPGNVNVYIDNTLKAAGGGFTVGSLSTGKAAGDTINFLEVTPDSTRVYINENSNAGFAVGKLGATIGRQNFMYLRKDNYFIGHNIGSKTTGIRNVLIGYEAGSNNTICSDNIFLGYQTGYFNTYGENNIFIGTRAGYNNSSQAESNNFEADNNVFIGNLSGYNNVLGFQNVAIGAESGYNNNTNYNVYIGYQAGRANVSGIQQVFIGETAGLKTTGRMNTFIGSSAGKNTVSGTDNCFMGTLTGWASRENSSQNTLIGSQSDWRNGTTGNYNTFLGFKAGATDNWSSNENIGQYNVLLGYKAGARNGNDLGNNNILIGYNAGYNITGSNKLYINSGSGIPLIYGEFDNKRIAINTTNTNSYTFYVNGSAGGTGNWNASSDRRLKTNITSIPDPLNKVKALNGVNFYWKDKKTRGNKAQIGFIAQDVEKILPEVVNKNGKYYSMQYAPITALLVEAIKEQQKQIEKLTNKLAELENQNKDLKVQVSDIQDLKSEVEVLKNMLKQILPENEQLKNKAETAR